MTRAYRRIASDPSPRQFNHTRCAFVSVIVHCFVDITSLRMMAVRMEEQLHCVAASKSVEKLYLRHDSHDTTSLLATLRSPQIRDND